MRRLAARGARDERGAVAVIVALVMVPLFAFAAISIDIAAMWWEKQQMRAGADAGALAIAQACGRGACGTPSGTAQQLVADNHHGTGATGSVTSLTASKVTVKASAPSNHVFAPIVGADPSTLISAEATVEWGAPSGGTAVLPLAFSWCEWQQQTSGAMPSGTTPRTIYLTKSSGTVGCTGPSNNLVPGGFGWLTTNSGTCGTATAIGQTIVSDPGNSAPAGCQTSFERLHDKTVLLPLFDSSTGTGSGATYHLYGYAAFRITGYHFGGQYNWNKPCNGDDRCVQGYFSRFVDLGEAFTYSAAAPELGASILKLTS